MLMGRAMTAGGELGNLARRLIVPRLRLIPGFRHKILDSKTPPLHRSALVHHGGRVRELAGTLCPNPVIDGHKRLDDLFAGQFVLVTSRPLTTAQQARLDARGAAVLTAAPGDELHRWLRRGRAHAALVRPDRTVMRADRDLNRLCHAVPAFTTRPSEHRLER
jgi:3-(3-hydroxy-phenyl)propionate hydroxylase